MIKKVCFLGLAFLIGWICGMNVSDLSTANIWDHNRNGLDDLNRMMRNDKTRRLGILAITEKQVYTVQSISPDEVRLVGGFVKNK